MNDDTAAAAADSALSVSNPEASARIRSSDEKYATAVGIYIAWRNGSLRGMNPASYLTVEANSSALIEAIAAVL